jgi:hypothetical protein
LHGDILSAERAKFHCRWETDRWSVRCVQIGESALNLNKCKTFDAVEKDGSAINSKNEIELTFEWTRRSVVSSEVNLTYAHPDFRLNGVSGNCVD